MSCKQSLSVKWQLGDSDWGGKNDVYQNFAWKEQSEDGQEKVEGVAPLTAFG